jgi:hypothetical protein
MNTIAESVAPSLKQIERLQAMVILYESVKLRITISFEEFIDALKDWDVIPLMQSKELIGAVILKKNEIHVGYAKKPMASIILHIKKTLSNIIKQFGFAITTVDSKNEKGLIFCKRLGFVTTKTDGGLVYLKCERCNYV